MIQHVVIDPKVELSFKRPFQKAVRDVVRVTNNSASTVAFKIKTTAPKQYCVFPNNGTVRAGDAREIQVYLQPMPADPPLDFKSRDKFLVQWFEIPADVDAESPDLWLWADIPSNKEIVNEVKLKCNYLPADSESIAAAANASSTIEDDQRDKSVEEIKSRISISGVSSTSTPAANISGGNIFKGNNASNASMNIAAVTAPTSASSSDQGINIVKSTTAVVQESKPIGANSGFSTIASAASNHNSTVSGDKTKQIESQVTEMRNKMSEKDREIIKLMAQLENLKSSKAADALSGADISGNDATIDPISGGASAHQIEFSPVLVALIALLAFLLGLLF